jgi:hypothetical protein
MLAKFKEESTDFDFESINPHRSSKSALQWPHKSISATVLPTPSAENTV